MKHSDKITVINPLTSIQGKVPPQALDLEESVLGSMVSQFEEVNSVMELLHEDMFYHQAHRLLFRSIRSLYLRREPVDMLTVGAELKKAGNFEIVGGHFFIANLSSKTVNSGNTEQHCYLIKEMFYKREMIRICSNTVSKAYNDTSDAFDLANDLNEVYDVMSADVGKAIISVKDLIMQRIKAYEIVVANGITGVPSGFKALDKITSGWQDTDLIIVAGRPAMGKTAFVVNCARNAAFDFQRPVLIFSLEMSKEQLMDRMISAETEIDGNTIKTRSLADWQWQTLHNKVGPLMEAPIHIDDTPGLNIIQFRAKAKKAKQEHDIQLIVIDYLQLMHGTREKGMNREQEISQISRELKSVAKELGIPVIALSQLSRAVETRPGARGKRPILSDLRESGSIEQDADLVLFLYRPEYYGITEDDQGRSMLGIGEVIVAKHRNGDTDTAALRFIGRFTKFTDLEDDYGQGVGSNLPTFIPNDPVFTMHRSSKFDIEQEDDAPF